MNTGEKLVALSSIASGTAAQHLLAIIIPETGLVYGGRTLVSMETERLLVSRGSDDIEIAFSDPPEVETLEERDDVFVKRADSQAVVRTSQSPIFVQKVRDLVTVQHTEEPSVFVIKQIR